MRRMVVAIFCVASLVSCVAQESVNEKSTEVLKSEAEWKSELTQEQYFILREKGTERPGTGKYNLHFEEGVYHCAGCNAPLFKSDSKFESHCGWPSFDQAVSDSTIVESVDTSHGMVRTEITCAKCGGHLGHVFDDGTTNTGLRYCVNSGALEFE